MNNLDGFGCAGGMECKVPDVPHGHSLQTAGNAAARPPVQSECSDYSWTVPYVAAAAGGWQGRIRTMTSMLSVSMPSGSLGMPASFRLSSWMSISSPLAML